jgi:hypothetical protein
MPPVVYYRVHESIANPMLFHPTGHISALLKKELPAGVSGPQMVPMVKAHTDQHALNVQLPAVRAFMWKHIFAEAAPAGADVFSSPYISVRPCPASTYRFLTIRAQITSSWLMAAHYSAIKKRNNPDADVWVSVMTADDLARAHVQPASAEALAEQCKPYWIAEGKPAEEIERLMALARVDKEYLVTAHIPVAAFVDIPAQQFFGSLPNIFFAMEMKADVHVVAEKDHIASAKRDIAKNLQKWAKKHPADYVQEIKRHAGQFANSVLGRARLGAHYVAAAEADLEGHVERFCHTMLAAKTAESAATAPEI